MENRQMQSQVDSANLKRRNKKLVVVIVVLAVVATLAVATAIGLGIGNSRSKEPVARRVEVAAPSVNSKPCGDYPFTATRKVVLRDFFDYGVYSDDPWTFCERLRIMRNEIYARHGYIFSSEDLRNHFGQKRWYTPISKNITLSDVEKFNVYYIQVCENELSPPMKRGEMQPGDGPWGTDMLCLFHSDGDGFLELHLNKWGEHCDYSYGYTKQELRYLRNSIYASRGYIFDDPDLREFFMRKWWYRPVTKTVELSDVEKHNVEFIKRNEQAVYGGN